MSLARLAGKVIGLRLFVRTGRFKFAGMLLTNQCDLRCAYCSIPSRHGSDLPVSTWLQITQRLMDWGVGHFSLLGGEPLLYDGLEEVVKYVAARRCTSSVSSNGNLLDRRRIRELAQAGLFTLVISVDKLRHPIKGDPSRALGLLEYARGAGIVPVVHSVISADNVDEVVELAEEVVERGIFFECCLYQSIGGELSRPIQRLIPGPDKTQEALQRLARIKRRTGMIRTSYAYMDNYRRYVGNPWHCDPDRLTWIDIDSDGSLMVCAERSTGIPLLELEAPDEAFLSAYREVAGRCGGCYFECYYTQQEVFGHVARPLSEIPVGVNFWYNTGRIVLANLFAPNP